VIGLIARAKLVGGKDCTTRFGRQGLEDREADQLPDEPDAAVGEQEIGPAGMHTPVLVAMGQTRGGIGSVPLAGDAGPPIVPPFGRGACSRCGSLGVSGRLSHIVPDSVRIAADDLTRGNRSQTSPRHPVDRVLDEVDAAVAAQAVHAAGMVTPGGDRRVGRAAVVLVLGVDVQVDAGRDEDLRVRW
jgi:hypothetical protein